jgi:hypothetical protein
VRAEFARRAVLAALGAGLVWALTWWIGMRPRPLLLVLAVIAAFAFVWLLEDVASHRYDLDLQIPRGRLVPRWGLDPRFSRLSAALRPPYDAQLVANQVHAALVPIVDDRLRAHHGIDRDGEPDRARAVMDPRLVAYVEQPPQARRNLMAYLSDIVARIEEL